MYNYPGSDHDDPNLDLSKTNQKRAAEQKREDAQREAEFRSTRTREG